MSIKLSCDSVQSFFLLSQTQVNFILFTFFPFIFQREKKWTTDNSEYIFLIVCANANKTDIIKIKMKVEKRHWRKEYCISVILWGCGKVTGEIVGISHHTVQLLLKFRRIKSDAYEFRRWCCFSAIFMSFHAFFFQFMCFVCCRIVVTFRLFIVVVFFSSFFFIVVLEFFV